MLKRSLKKNQNMGTLTTSVYMSSTCSCFNVEPYEAVSVNGKKVLEIDLILENAAISCPDHKLMTVQSQSVFLNIGPSFFESLVNLLKLIFVLIWLL